MKRIIKYITYVWATFLAITLYSCSDEVVSQPGPTAEGTLLNLYIGNIATPGTRVTELGGSGNISNGERPTNDPNGGDKKNIGLYIYYQVDYDANILSRPYVRNLECEVTDGRIVPKDKGDVYIYDRMTIVAFYPYNAEADDYTFTNKNDEKKYPITESDYSRQYYIPYRAQANVNPTNAYHVSLNLVPQQTVKIQVVLVSDDESLFPEGTDGKDGKVKLVPAIDSQNNEEGTTGDRRENWVDIIEQPYGSALNPPSGGSRVQRYTSYIWKNNDPKSIDNPHHGDTPNHHDNTFKKGDILLQSEKLTLFFPEDLDIQEGNVYRYGYNLTTGEMFIPTSDNLIYDATTLASGKGGYQVCDINLKDYGDWAPVNLTGTYDGGGHAIQNMEITNVPADRNIGLFGSVTGGGSIVKNLHLEKPVITVTNSDETEMLNVGGLVGQLNRSLTPEEEVQRIEALRNALIASLPPGLPQSVIDALLADMLKDYIGAGTSNIQGCKVSDPKITVTGSNVVVGGLAGTVGADENYKGAIKDSYVWGGNIKINEGDDSHENVWAGAFAGILNGGTITNSYTTAEAEGYVKPTAPATTPEDVVKGFANVVNPAPDGTGISGSFTANPKGKEEGDGVTLFTSSWSSWGTTTEWPKAHSTLGNYWGSMGSSATSTYPTLVWETPLNVQK